MRRSSLVLVSSLLALSVCLPQPAAANPALRKQIDQRGDFLLLGNTLAYDCNNVVSSQVDPPIVGTIGDCADSNFAAPDVYFRSDDPTAGAARAAGNITPAQARSTAVLTLPADAEVTYARIYWGSYAENMSPSPNAHLERPGAGVDSSLTADKVWTVMETNVNSRFWYQATADVTEIVRTQGSGAYRLGDITSVPIYNVLDFYAYSAWYMVVFYKRDAEPQRNLALFDGLDLVEPGGPAEVKLEGFLVPASGFDAKLGIAAYEGDEEFTGDAITFDGTTLSDAQNPADNFFNSTRSYLTKPVSVAGDLPQLTGKPRSMSGIDLDVIDLGQLVKPGQKSATLNANTAIDTFLLASFVTSISTLKPNFQTSSKQVEDVNGGGARPGDELAYTIDIANHGSDDSIETVVSDVLPKGVTFVPGSIEIVSGARSGKKTDQSGDDEAEYDDGARTITVRIGANANATTGGSLAVDEETQLRFRVKIDTDTRGVISNQALIRAKGKKGAASEDTPTDGDGLRTGTQGTDITVNVCDVDMDCKEPTPFCDISSDPQGCVECVTSLDCKDPAKPDCQTATHLCGCVLGDGKCQTDTDADGISDDGETAIGTDPNDYDTDDDGTSDGAEFTPELDSDGDGVDNAHDADSDNDGLFDGTEQGFDCSNPGTNLKLGRCRADADGGKTKTNPVKADSDRGGVSDGSEDPNLNGAVEAGETDPSWDHGADDVEHDADKDGLSDELEKFLHGDPADADTDDDGVPDGKEANPSEDTDLDRLVNLLDVDSDDDALFDGTELGFDCSAKGTAVAKNHCRADADSGKTKTSPLLRDTDKGGVRDGSEDANSNGRLDADETDPTREHGADDGKVKDTDGDGLSDPLEMGTGSKPNDKDSDDDGVLDGDEPNPLDDHDGDGKLNLLDSDSDDDALFDGTEYGHACTDAATDLAAMQCTPDADSGATRTGLLSADSDRGSVADGVEDVNHNGRIDPAELDPNDPKDDVIGKPCTTDRDCGGATSGLVCKDGMCAFGCRSGDGNTCPDPLFCSATTNGEIGVCADEMPAPPVVDAGVVDAGPALAPGGKLGGAGCNCRVGPELGASNTAPAWLLAAWVLLWYSRRRSRA